MRHKYEYGEAVRLTRNIRNDGTFPGAVRGKLLIRSGSVGYIRDVGTFLQDQIIYSVDFINSGTLVGGTMVSGIIVGCREQELQYENDPWIATRFDFKDKVTPTIPLAIKTELIVEPGDAGEVEKVLRNYPGGPAYHVRFSGRTLLVTEYSLEFLQAEKGE